ncbi:hypothetical protein LJ739_00080 [Aestuariibacter halophilus]|uniref:Alpha/beta hydrolase n=1 Tax=Fluctibacter halophilus TaxID=226011 RepID=A0ABS8G4Q3_9ALTE|nr:hypothetical protein [Aestuariibacter halophilus]MCC2614634.1 hypothetical protein [Aestuariibacter halophilus]
MKTGIMFVLLATTAWLSGCAYTPVKGQSPHYDNYAEKSRQHILRVSRHGYLVENEIVRESPLFRDIHKHLTLEEVQARYKTIFLQAFKLSCKNTESKGDSSAADDAHDETSTQQCMTAAQMYMDAVVKTPDAQGNTSTNNGLEQAHEAMKTAFIDGKRPVKFMIYFHGGLNTYAATDQRMETQLEYIKAGLPLGSPLLEQHAVTDDWQYPVYVSWPSNPSGTYWEHLTGLREGRRPRPVFGWLSSPVVLLEDLITSIGEFPSNVYYQFTNDKDRFASRGGLLLSSSWTEAYNQFDSLQCHRDNTEDHTEALPNRFAYKRIDLKGDSTDKPPAHIDINRSVYRYGSLGHYAKTSVFTVVSPLRYVIGSLWNGTIAGNAWKVMKRRARNMFDPTGDSDTRLEERFGKGYKDGIGSSLGSFFESLFALKQAMPELDLQITLVGHSMGTIAINNLLEKYQQQWRQSDMLKDIVFMAAAASTQETLAIVPDILRAKHRINFYNLTLNRVSEVAEFYAFGLAPSGSLLVSIDKYHDEPEHHLKRTFGAEINVQSSLPAILQAFDGVNGNVTLKAFHDIEQWPNGVEPSLPRKHGDFGALNYWLPVTWQISDDKNQHPDPASIQHCAPVVERPIHLEPDPQEKRRKPTDVLFGLPQ